MGKKDFDNLMLVIEGLVLFTTTTVASLEIDFELPRGFIAKIWEVELFFERLGEDFEGADADAYARLEAALVRDPDDITTTTMPSNSTQHDVILDHSAEIIVLAGTAEEGIHVTDLSRKLSIPEHVDVITARNMRLNVDGNGTDVGSLTEALGVAHIFYTLEKVTDIDILNLLDIL